MPKPAREEVPLILRFGGGLHSRASEDAVDEMECTDGENFDLDGMNDEYRPRAPFDLVGTVPNGSEIRGFASLLKSDGTVSTLVQAGSTVYEWDGGSGFTAVGSCSAGAKLRGRLEHNWQLSDKVLITDLTLTDPVKEWDGTTFQNVTFAGGFGTFRARYCYVENERAIFANVYSNGTTTPHLLVGSKRGDYTTITVSNRPSSSLSEEDPFFLIQPDNFYINGIAGTRGVLILSSERGSIYKLTGSSAKDYAMAPFFPRSGAYGDEAMVYAGNDAIYGRGGRIESAVATDTFGDIDSDDLSRWIGHEVNEYDEWLLAYNSRLKRVYCHPVGASRFYVYHQNVAEASAASEAAQGRARQSRVSPWSRWTTTHPMSLNPTCMMNVLDPVDGLEYVLMGCASGCVYRLEGSGTAGDGGTNPIVSYRTSKLFTLGVDGRVFELTGHIRYRKNAAIGVDIEALFAGRTIRDELVTITVPAVTIGAVYGGSYYYGGSSYYGISGLNRWAIQPFVIAGHSSAFQIRVAVTDTESFNIGEVGIRHQAAA